jgi:hypothetical protein
MRRSQDATGVVKALHGGRQSGVDEISFFVVLMAIPDVVWRKMRRKLNSSFNMMWGSYWHVQSICVTPEILPERAKSSRLLVYDLRNRTDFDEMRWMVGRSFTDIHEGMLPIILGTPCTNVDFSKYWKIFSSEEYFKI